MNRLGEAPIPSVHAAAWITTVKARPARAEDLIPFTQRALEELGSSSDVQAIARPAPSTGSTACIRWISGAS